MKKRTELKVFIGVIVFVLILKYFFYYGIKIIQHSHAYNGTVTIETTVVDIPFTGINRIWTFTIYKREDVVDSIQNTRYVKRKAKRIAKEQIKVYKSSI